MQEFLGHSGILTIDLEALADNYRLFQSKVGSNCAVAGVVKANAYGLGLKQVAEKLTELGCPQFFVATLDEALEFRGFNSASQIAVLGGLYEGAEEAYIAENITPVLNSLSDIKRWVNKGQDKNESLPAIIHFDTGMNRLGLGARETKEFLGSSDLRKGLNLQLIMSHFACADELDHPLTKKQRHNFVNIAQHFPDVRLSLANSPGLFRSDTYHYDMVRPGYALYGGNPTPEAPNPMKPVVSLNARILQIHQVSKGRSVGYGATHVFNQNATIATVALGYADGFLRSGSGSADGGATLYWHGQPCAVLGRISMDLVSVDMSGLSGQPPVQGAGLEILGPHQGIDDLANASGTIGYEILTSLGARYHRQYV